MSFYYPQAALILRVAWEEFKDAGVAQTSKVHKLEVKAKRITVNINDYTQADTFSAELDYKNFPFDPRSIRSLGVTVFMKNMKNLYVGDNISNQIEPQTGDAIFQGFADEESIDFDDDSRTIKFEGRDFTSLLIDAPYDIRNPLDLRRRLDTILLDLLRNLPATRPLALENRVFDEQGNIETLPTLGQLAPDYNKMSGHKNTKKNETYWEVIQDLVSRAGLIAFIEIDKLVVTKPQNVYSKKIDYQFIYGRNLQTLNFKRKLGRQKGFNVGVRSLNLESKPPVIEARIPLEANDDWLKSMGLKREEIQIEKLDASGKIDKKPAPYIGFRIPDIATKKELIIIGQGTFEEMGRQQIEGSLTTKEMTLRQGDDEAHGVEFDITKIRNGTPVRIEIDQNDMAQATRIKDENSRIQYLIGRGYEPDVAVPVGKGLSHFDTKFYTRAVQFTLDENGFKMSLDFVNFINASADKKKV